MNDPVSTVQSIYAAFGRGDVPGILEQMSPEVDWEYAFAPNDVPWLQRQRGRSGVAAFFAALAEGLQLTTFTPKEMLVGKDKVVVIVDIAGTVPRTGGTLAEEDEVHIWHFGPDGKVSRFRHVLDTLQHHRAWHGS